MGAVRLFENAEIAKPGDERDGASDAFEMVSPAVAARISERGDGSSGRIDAGKAWKMWRSANRRASGGTGGVRVQKSNALSGTPPRTATPCCRARSRPSVSSISTKSACDETPRAIASDSPGPSVCRRTERSGEGSECLSRSQPMESASLIEALAAAWLKRRSSSVIALGQITSPNCACKARMRPMIARFDRAEVSAMTSIKQLLPNVLDIHVTFDPPPRQLDPDQITIDSGQLAGASDADQSMRIKRDAQLDQEPRATFQRWDWKAVGNRVKESQASTP